MYYKRISSGGKLRLDVSTEQSLEYIENMARNECKVLILDVDGTLRCGNHRLDLLPSEEYIHYWEDEPNKAFAEFNEQCHNDSPLNSVIDVANTLISTGEYYVIVLTSCTYSEHTGSVLTAQLNSWGVESDMILMRHPEIHLWPVEFKEVFFDQMNLFGDPDRVVMIDDNPDICNMARSKGVLALQCEDWVDLKSPILRCYEQDGTLWAEMLVLFT